MRKSQASYIVQTDAGSILEAFKTFGQAKGRADTFKKHERKSHQIVKFEPRMGGSYSVVYTKIPESSFEFALLHLPDVCGYDGHKTIKDLCWLCLHELDLHAEREYFCPVKTRTKLLNFCIRFGYYSREAQHMFDSGFGLARKDFL
jgi:hypothetical protein